MRVPLAFYTGVKAACSTYKLAETPVMRALAESKSNEDSEQDEKNLHMVNDNDSNTPNPNTDPANAMMQPGQEPEAQSPADELVEILDQMGDPTSALPGEEPPAGSRMDRPTVWSNPTNPEASGDAGSRNPGLGAGGAGGVVF